MSDRWRLFVAVPIGDELRQSLAQAVAGWSTDPALEGLRWSEPESWHVTLAFLGSVETDAVDGVGATVRTVAARHELVSLTTGGLGVFPSAGRARVVWYGIADPAGRLAALANDLNTELRLAARAGPYRPHLTLARARREPVPVRGWLNAASAPAGQLDVGSIVLMRSHLGRGPARYEALATLPLAEVARV